LVTLIAALCAGLAGTVASGLMAWIAIGAAALGGAYFASRTTGAARRPGDAMRARRLLLLVDRGGSADSKTPPEFTDEWAQLYEKVNRLVVEARTTPDAVAQLEQ